MITFDGYTLDGFKLTFSLPCDTIEEALYHVRAAKNAGVTPEPQDPDAQQTETIVTVVRREHVNGKTGKITPVVDFYPDWKGDYGQFKFCHVYLNSPEDIAAFESHSGLNLVRMPLYDSQGPLKRMQNNRKTVEITCKPFVAHKVAAGEKEIEGKVQTLWDFAGYGGAAMPQANTPAPVQAPTPELSAQAEHWSDDPNLVKAMYQWASTTFNLKTKQIDDAIHNTGRNISAFTRNEVKGAVLAYAAQYNAEKMGSIGEDKGLSPEIITAAMSITLTEFPE